MWVPYPVFPLCKANIHRQWSVTLRFVAIFLKNGKMFTQDDRVSPFDMTLAFPVSLGRM